MPNARGKLKEEVEGIHSSLEWVRVHCEKSIVIIGDTHPELREYFSGLASLAKQLDEGAGQIWAKL